MVRQYPRFLYSNPQNSKSKGPFIIHTMEPRVIILVMKLVPGSDFKFGDIIYPVTGIRVSDSYYLYKLISETSSAKEEVLPILEAAADWFRNQPEYRSF